MKIFSTFSGIGGFERGIDQAWKSVINARNQENSTKVDEYVRSASGNINSSGDSTILNTAGRQVESTMRCDVSECLICTGRSVFAAKNLSQSSSRSNTETMTDISTESNTEQAICTNLHSKNTNQISTKSFATTATTPKDDTESAPTCVGYSEIDKYARSVYEKHYPEAPAFGDITKINAEELPDFDCLVGGFPCQAFSIAGKRKGFEDTRGTLFFDLARILRAKQPRLFVFENVKGLLSHDSGRTFKTIIEAIDELGYDCQWQVINSKNHGVPQNRERVYIVGHLRGTPRPQVFPITGSGEEVETVTHPTIDANYYKGYSNQRKMVQVPEATKKGYAEASVGDAINLTAINSKTRRGRVSDIAPTVDTGMQLHTLTEDVRIRRLTPIECERLQGFPDNWTAQGIDGAISDTQRYKMCGNAVTTNVVQSVFEKILSSYEL